VDTVAALIVGAVITVAVYGSVCLVVGRRFIQSRTRGVGRVAWSAALLILLWPVCLVVGAMIAFAIPLPWGHAGGLFLLVYVPLSLLILGGTSLAFYSDSSARPLRTGTPTELKCQSCHGRITFDDYKCPHCGLRFADTTTAP